MNYTVFDEALKGLQELGREELFSLARFFGGKVFPLKINQKRQL
jgi:hypothetical protein